MVALSPEAAGAGLGDDAQRALRSVSRHLSLGGVFVVLLFGFAGGWAATTEFSGAVIAPGTLVVDSSVKKVQHPVGGVVGELRVRDGDRVQSGEILIRLDETVTRANLSIVTKSLDELYARLARLEAERDGAHEVVFPPELTSRADQPEIQRLMAAESGLFRLRAVARDGLKAQLSERVAQLKEEISGLTFQIDAKQIELNLIDVELQGVNELYKQKLTTLARVNQLERNVAQLKGDRGRLISATAQTKGKIVETELQILQVDQDLRGEVAKEMREIQAKIAELVERKVAAEDQLKRIELRAPQDGVVHQLSIHTVGGVIGPGEQIMLIVPDSDRLTIEARIAPQNIDDVRVGQAATLKFSAFNARTTPEVQGEVQRVSPDLSVDQRTGAGYYTARISILPDRRVETLRLIPGMPVETFIQTAPRTVLSYFTKPLTDQLFKAFREK
ncbi:HlyD family type I secretion periplasmic adaptor subunit [Prosthecomicrobium sp. N25]|uniref:HlyD family type I secretion periplasmic adaptor subunit n=1 Tax=Prosthecomicrobium sp. N25 TaxID=3129254 RepID=UPI003077675F